MCTIQYSHAECKPAKYGFVLVFHRHKFLGIYSEKFLRNSRFSILPLPNFWVLFSSAIGHSCVKKGRKKIFHAVNSIDHVTHCETNLLKYGLFQEIAVKLCPLDMPITLQLLYQFKNGFFSTQCRDLSFLVVGLSWGIMCMGWGDAFGKKCGTSDFGNFVLFI